MPWFKLSLSTTCGRNYVTEERAINEYLLEPGDLTGLRMTVRRSAHEMDPPHRVYWRCECYLAAGETLTVVLRCQEGYRGPGCAEVGVTGEGGA